MIIIESKREPLNLSSILDSLPSLCRLLTLGDHVLKVLSIWTLFSLFYRSKFTLRIRCRVVVGVGVGVGTALSSFSVKVYRR